MKSIIFIVLIVILQTSVLIHIHSMIGYISTKNNKYFTRFIITALSNTGVGIVIAIFVMLDTTVLNGLKLDVMLILESGLIFFYMIFIKVTIIVNIVKRIKKPENYHLNYFGKKVYEKKIVDPKELATFYLTLPLTLFAGAYFFVKIFRLY